MQAYIYLRRVRYTPLDWAGASAGTWGQYGGVVYDGVTSVSMTALHGSLNAVTSSMVSVASASINAAAALPAAAGRRHSMRKLAQVGPSLNAAGQAIPSDTSASSEQSYYLETLSIQAAVSKAVGQAVGIPASSVIVSVTGHSVTGLLLLSGVSYATYTSNPGVAKNLTDSIGIWTIPMPGDVFFSAVYDATVPANWNLSAPLLAAPPPGYNYNTPGVLINYIVDGYECQDPGVVTWYNNQVVNGNALACNDAGMAAAGSDSVTINTMSAKLLNIPSTRIGPLAVPGGLSIMEVTVPPVATAAGPLVSAKVAVAMVAPAISPAALQATTGAPPLTGLVLQAAFDNALNSNLIQIAIENAEIAYMQNVSGGRRLLQSAPSTVVTAPTNAQTARFVTAQLTLTGGGTCSGTMSAPASSEAAHPNILSFNGSSLQAYYGTMIAFIVAFALQSVVLIVVLYRNAVRGLVGVERLAAVPSGSKWTERTNAMTTVHPEAPM